MTIHTHENHFLSVRTAALAFAGALLAGVVGFGVATVVIDEAVPAPPAPTDTGGDPRGGVPLPEPNAPGLQP